MLHSPAEGAAGATDMKAVKVIRDQDPTQAGDDFLRVSCRDDADGTGVTTVIERVLARDGDTGCWRFRRLFDGMCVSPEAALALATAYAEHKGIPIVYADVEQD
jgi:hypothetical protein